jgi:hypothetical protein
MDDAEKQPLLDPTSNSLNLNSDNYKYSKFAVRRPRKYRQKENFVENIEVRKSSQSSLRKY